MTKRSLGNEKFWGPGGLSMTPTDRQIFREDIDGFLPEKVFDMHVHLHGRNDMGWPIVGMRLVQDFQKMLFPGRECANLLLPFAMPGFTSEQANRMAVRELGKHGGTNDATLMFVEPSMSADYVREQAIKSRAVGFKVYMSHSTAKDKTNAPIRSFLTEKHIKVMEELGLMVMLHLSRRRAIADPANIREIELLSKRYPNTKWVLAHCARCFRPGLFEKVVDRLNALPNVYVETAGVCEPLVFIEVFKNYDLSRLMFGTDNLAAGGMRGRYMEAGLFWVLVGRPGFFWGDSRHSVQPTFVVYEQLRSMARAARLVGVGKKDIRNIFWNNAIKLLKRIRGISSNKHCR